MMFTLGSAIVAGCPRRIPISRSILSGNSRATLLKHQTMEAVVKFPYFLFEEANEENVIVVLGPIFWGHSPDLATRVPHWMPV